MAVLAVVLVLSVVWTVNHTIEVARVSSHWIVHTQEVLTAIETVLAKVADAESAVRSYVSSGDVRVLEPLDRVEGAIDADLNRLAALTTDNPTQQSRMPPLRQGATRALAALRARAEAKRTARPFNQADVDALQEGMDAARTAMQAMRAEENRLLVAVSRRARHLSVTASRDGGPENHRDRTRGHGPSPGWHDLSAPPVRREDDDRR